MVNGSGLSREAGGQAGGLQEAGEHRAPAVVQRAAPVWVAEVERRTGDVRAHSERRATQPDGEPDAVAADPVRDPTGDTDVGRLREHRAGSLDPRRPRGAGRSSETEAYAVADTTGADVRPRRPRSG
jgi:hypothetical protein